MFLRSMVVVGLLLSGCATSGDSGSSVAAYEREIKAYAQCNLIKSFDFSKLEGDVFSLAIAAEGACIESKRALARAIVAHDGLATSQRLIAILERESIRGNAGEIANFRAKRNSN